MHKKLKGIVLSLSLSLLSINCFGGDSITLKDFNIDDITSTSVNLSTKRFLISLTSDDIQRRNNAKIYLLGILDATEGKSWCDYRTFKTITLQEAIYQNMKDLSEAELQERAADKILGILAKKFPCSGKK